MKNRNFWGTSLQNFERGAVASPPRPPGDNAHGIYEKNEGWVKSVPPPSDTKRVKTKTNCLSWYWVRTSLSMDVVPKSTACYSFIGSVHFFGRDAFLSVDGGTLSSHSKYYITRTVTSKRRQFRFYETGAKLTFRKAGAHILPEWHDEYCADAPGSYTRWC